MEYCVNLLVSVPIEAVEDATIEELIYQAEKMLGKEVERLATASIYKEGEVKPIYEGEERNRSNKKFFNARAKALAFLRPLRNCLAPLIPLYHPARILSIVFCKIFSRLFFLKGLQS